MPSLRTLVLDNLRWECPHDEWPIHLPSLEVLVGPLTDPDEVTRVLDACPALKVLHVVVPSEDQDEDFEPNWILDADTLARLPRVPSVHALGISNAETEAWAIAHFNAPHRPEFVLQYLPDVVPAFANTIAQQLPDIVAFGLTRALDVAGMSVAVMTMQSSRGMLRIRRLFFPLAHVNAVTAGLTALGPSSLKSLQIDASIAPVILRPGVILPRLKSLVLEICAEGAVSAFQAVATGAVPALQVFMFDSPRRLHICAEFLTDVLAKLCGSVVLKELNLKGVVPYGDTRIFTRRVQRIRCSL